MDDQPAPTTTDLESSLHQTDKLDVRVWLRLLTCSTMIEQRVRAGLRERFGITLPRFDLLAQLDRAEDGLTMGELSSRLMVSNGNVTGLTDRLVLEGLVSRTPLPGDRRTSLVRLTPKGKAVFDTMTPAHAAWVDDMLGGMDRDDKAALLGLLAKLKASVAAAQDPVPKKPKDSTP